MARGKAVEKAQILIRQNLALQLKQDGLSYRAIGEKLGVDHTQAWHDVKNAIAELNALKLDTAEDYRELELARLDMLTKGLEPMARVGNPMAVNAYVKVMEQRAKLLGLYAPEKKDINIKDLNKLSDDELRAIAED